MVIGLVGKVDFTVRHLSSATSNFPSSWDFSSNQQCIGSGARQVEEQIILSPSIFTSVMFPFISIIQFLQILISMLLLITRRFWRPPVALNYILVFPLSFYSVLHILLVLHQRQHGPCVQPFQNMLLLWLPSLARCYSLYVKSWESTEMLYALEFIICKLKSILH